MMLTLVAAAAEPSAAQTFLQHCVIGLTNGSLFALIALGYTMVYGIIDLVNFAHGDLFMLGSFLAMTLVGALGLATAGSAATVLGVVCLLVIVPIFCAALNLTVDRLVYKPLRSAPKLAPLVSAIGVSFIFMNIGLLWGGAADRSFPDLVARDNLFAEPGLEARLDGVKVVEDGRGLMAGDRIVEIDGRDASEASIAKALKDHKIGSHARVMVERSGALVKPDILVVDKARLQFTKKDLMVILITVPIMIALTLMVKFTKLGKAMRATAQNPVAAQLMGIDVDRVIGATFVIGGALAGVASVVYGLYINTISFQMGFQNGLYAFTAAVLGGIGNLPGAVLGALIIGLVRSLGSGYLDEKWTSALIFVILIVILIFRPSGLLGARTREKV